VLYHQWIQEHSVWFILYKRVPFVLISCIAFLMISQIPFPSFKQYRVVVRWYHLVGIILGWILLLWLFIKGYPLMLVGINSYIVYGLAVWAYQRLSACDIHKV